MTATVTSSSGNPKKSFPGRYGVLWRSDSLTLAKNLRRTQLWSVTVLGYCLLLFTQTFSRLFKSKLTFFSDLFPLHFSPPCFFRSSRPLLFTSLPAANYHRWDLQIATITNQIKPLKLKAQSPFLPRLPLFGFNVV